MKKLLLLLLYFVGCILSFGRVNAYWHTSSRTTAVEPIGLYIVGGACSWLGFVAGVAIYSSEQKFLLYSNTTTK